MSNNQKQIRPKPLVLAILDGWGVAPPYSGNAVTEAKLPNFDQLVAQYPTAVLSASGEAVGLTWGEIGNSEVGHLNLGAGRIVYQNMPRINKAISDNSFFSNKALVGTVEHVKKNKSKLHLMGLLSTGGVHGAIEHLISLLVFASEQKVSQVYLHLFLDGRDMAFNSGQQLLADIQKKIVEYKVGTIATISGRFYAMDRNNHWDRIEQSYQTMALGKSEKTFDDPQKAVEHYYSQKIYDEKFTPTVITKNNKSITTIDDNDAIVFFNFRADRAREMTKAFVLPGFDKFDRGKDYKNLYFVSMTEYEKDLPVEVAFPPEIISNSLGQVLSQQGLKQLRIAETEKYAHVTYFFNGGKEGDTSGEEKVVIPSPNVESYAEEPKMSAPQITAQLKKEISSGKHDFILVNYANGDMVGHTGDLKATITALEYLDKVLSELTRSVLVQDGVIIITADHGNAEEMFNMQTGAINKEHTTNPVPLIIVGKQFEGKTLSRADIAGSDLSVLQPRGILSDIAPTILKIMGIEKPVEMTGRALI